MTEQQLSQSGAAGGSAEPAEPWRNEVQDRLARYKRRRGRRIEGAFTMRFPFPVDGAAESASAAQPEEQEIESAVELLDPSGADAPQVPLTQEPAAALIENPVVVAESEEESTPAPVDFVLEPPPAVEEEEAVPFVDALPRPRPKRKVIAFPRHLSAATPEAFYRLADPVLAEAPRILDVPEELEAIPATPFLDGLQLDLPSSAAEREREQVELPNQPVHVTQRILAGAVDFAVVGAGVATFAAVAYRILQSPPVSKPLFLGLAGTFGILWSAYHYLFLVHAGKTLGMMAARVSMRTFNGTCPKMQQRRLRAMGLFLSTFSMGMGLMWAFVDTDRLCWHDRLSQTFLYRRS